MDDNSVNDIEKEEKVEKKEMATDATEADIIDERKKEEPGAQEDTTPQETGEKFLCKAEWIYKPDTYLSCSKDIKPYSYVVTEHSDVGLAVVRIKGIIKASVEEAANPDFKTAFPPILRTATSEDLENDKKHKELAKEMARFTQDQTDLMKMDMDVVGVILSLDGKRALIMYTAPGRVDFRNFLKVFTSKYHVRLEMRQIGPRDKARIVGGIGVCGLPLCCKTFLTQFNGVTIAMAKNQLLSLNVPKLSGQCGKLMCCLGYENDFYQQLRPLFPSVGDKVTVGGKELTVTAMNIIADTITVTDGDSYDTYSNANWKRLTEGKAPLPDREDDEVQAKVMEVVQANKKEGPSIIPTKEEDEDEEGKQDPRKDEEKFDDNFQEKAKMNSADEEYEDDDENDDDEDENKNLVSEEQEMDNRNFNGRNSNRRDNNHNKNNNANNHHGNHRFHKGKGKPFGKPGPFGFKPRRQSNEEQAAANPFGFASHNVEEKSHNRNNIHNDRQEKAFDPQKLTLPQTKEEHHTNKQALATEEEKEL